METKLFDYHVKLPSQGACEDFANCIKDAVVAKIAHQERFGSIRLRSTTLRVNDFLHPNLRGYANERDGMQVRQTQSALQLAGTVIHEMGHMLVGTAQQHNKNWIEACAALGLSAKEFQDYAPSDFSPDVLAAIEAAIKVFSKLHPELVYDPNIEIPWPSDIGLYDCELPHESYHPCEIHKAHILKFQMDGIRWMLQNPKNILLGDEMGLGKTVSVMGYINAVNPRRILVACPNNAKLVWLRHFQKFCIHKDLTVELAYTKFWPSFLADVVIANYEALNKWADVAKADSWDLLIADEGQYLKNPSAKRSKAYYPIVGKKEIIITGTPIVNYPYEIFPLIHKLDRERWPEYGRFEMQYGSRTSEKLGRNLNQLNNILRSTIMLRRLKKEVLKELPVKRRSVTEFVVDDETRELIEEEKRLFNVATKGDDSESVRLLNAMKNESDVMINDIDWAALILELKNTRKYAFEEMARIAHKIARAKIPFVIEEVEQALENREKVILFGHHRDVLEQLAARFAPNSVLLLGGNSNQIEAIEQAKDRFNNDPECRVFVSGITLAQSYSLTGCSTVLFCEESWIPGDMTQAEDRAHGIGRGDADAKSMLIKHMVFEDSLDTKKAQLTIRKQQSIERALNARHV